MLHHQESAAKAQNTPACLTLITHSLAFARQRSHLLRRRRLGDAHQFANPVEKLQAVLWRVGGHQLSSLLTRYRHGAEQHCGQSHTGRRACKSSSTEVHRHSHHHASRGVTGRW